MKLAITIEIWVTFVDVRETVPLKGGNKAAAVLKGAVHLSNTRSWRKTKCGLHKRHLILPVLVNRFHGLDDFKCEVWIHLTLVESRFVTCQLQQRIKLSQWRQCIALLCLLVCLG